MIPDAGRDLAASSRRGVSGGAGVSREPALRLVCNEPAAEMASGRDMARWLPVGTGTRGRQRGAAARGTSGGTIRSRACALWIHVIPTPKLNVSKTPKPTSIPSASIRPRLSVRSRYCPIIAHYFPIPNSLCLETCVSVCNLAICTPTPFCLVARWSGMCQWMEWSRSGGNAPCLDHHLLVSSLGPGLGDGPGFSYPPLLPRLGGRQVMEDMLFGLRRRAACWCSMKLPMVMSAW